MKKSTIGAAIALTMQAPAYLMKIYDFPSAIMTGKLHVMA
jgi:hypothetical protein